MIDVVELLIEYYNWIVHEYGPNEYEEKRLVDAIAKTGVGNVIFNDEINNRTASIK